MSSGGAEVVGELLKIPVAREITVAVLWFMMLQFAVAEGEWGLFGLTTAFAVAVLGVAWLRYRRRNRGGGGKLALAVVVVLMAAPLLLVAWRRRRREEGRRAWLDGA